MEKLKVNWGGNLNDDCTAEWEGMILRAEEMDKSEWWWAVYSINSLIDSSNNYHDRVFKTGKIARNAAEKAALDYLNLKS